jgi:hypothetical protein
VSKSTVSRICTEIDQQVAVLRGRRLDHTDLPYVFLDATYVKAKIDHQVVSRAVVIATGVTADGNREVLGVDVGDSEDELFWTGFLRSLNARAPRWSLPRGNRLVPSPWPTTPAALRTEDGMTHIDVSRPPFCGSSGMDVG